MVAYNEHNKSKQISVFFLHDYPIAYSNLGRKCWLHCSVNKKKNAWLPFTFNSSWKLFGLTKICVGVAHKNNKANV